MKTRTIIVIVVFALVSVNQALAAITVIDFESLSELTVVHNQFDALGADFNSSALIYTQGSALNPNYPAYSGVNVASYNHREGTGIIRIDSVGSLWSMVGGYVTGASNVTMKAYDSGGTILGVLTTPGANFVGAGTGLSPNLYLSYDNIPAPYVAYVEFSADGNFFTLDDFTFQAVPAPGALILGGIGAGLVGWLRKRKAI